MIKSKAKSINSLKLHSVKPKGAEDDFSDAPKLKINRASFEKILIALILLVLAVFFIKTGVWEYYYYSGKEGSTRATVQTVDSETEAAEVDETPVTDAQITEWVVAADHPRYLSIEKLGVKNARVRPMGLRANGELDTPYSIFDVGWYTSSSRPGYGGVIMIDGHNGGPNVEGVFKHIDQLYADDLITLERGDGAIFTYRVVENNTISLEDADAYMKTALTSAIPGDEGLTLITCIGEWSQVRQTYLSRQFVRAVLVK